MALRQLATAISHSHPRRHSHQLRQHQPPHEPTKEEEEGGGGGERISNRWYWTKKIHTLCSVQNNVDAGLRLLAGLRRQGYRPDSLNLSSIVHALCDSGRFDEAHHRLLLCIAANWLPDDRTADVLLARLLDSRSPNLTLKVFQTLVASKPSFFPSLTNHNRLINQFCSLSQPITAQNILQEMKKEGRQNPNSISYTAVVNGFARIGELELAQKVFDEMVASGIRPNSLSYSVLIKGYLRKRKNLDEGKKMMGELWRRMEEEEEEDPSVKNAAFANLIDALCREGFFHEVFRIAEEIIPQGKCVGKEFAYGQMIDSLCRAGKHHGASRIVYMMRKKGFMPSLVSYNCIVHGLSKEGGCMRAYQLFKEGIEFDYSPSESTYKVLIEGLCQQMDLYKAKDVTEFMLQKEEGVKRTRVYNIFLSALILVKNPSEQLTVLVSMLENHCQPDAVTLNTVIHGFCKVGKVDEALTILRDMLAGNFCAPDVVTFTTIIHGLLHTGRMEEAIDMLHQKMPESCCTPSTVTYNVILHGLCKLHEIDRAMEIFNEMVDKGVIADSKSYTALLDGLWKMGRVKEAKRFWDDVVWPSKVHDDFVYGATIRGLCNLGKFDEACDFLYELVDCGVAPGIVNYNILIDNACRLGLKREAYKIVGELRKNGLTPDAVTWRILDKKLHKKDEDS